MVDRSAMERAFRKIGVDIEDSSIIDLSMDLCVRWSVDPSQFIDMWSVWIGAKGIDEKPTVQNLEEMARRPVSELTKHRADADEHGDHGKEQLSIVTEDEEICADDRDILEMYGIQRSQIKKVKRERSPDESDDPNLRERKKQAVESTFSPASYKNFSTPRSVVTYSESQNSVLRKFGKNVIDWKTKNPRRVSVGKSNDDHVPSQVRYLFELLSKKSSVLGKVCREFGAELCKIWPVPTGEKKMAITANVRAQSQTKFRTWGKIFSRGKEKLDPERLLLEGCKRNAEIRHVSNTVAIDFSQLDDYSIFPGQILAIEGTNPTGNVLVAETIFSAGCPPPAPTPRFDENLHIVVGAGLFTDSKILEYKPLFQLLDHVVDTEPHVLILIGPFIPANHPEIIGASIRDTYQRLFEQLVEKIMTAVKGRSTQVVLVPSPDDVHHHSVYPTPEFQLPKHMETPNLHLMTDPCMVDIEGLVVGVTSVDIIRHLSEKEIHRNESTDEDRPSRLANHLLSQASFYPLYPPDKVNVDTGLWLKYGLMYQQPHILILPSDMRHFSKWTQHCFVINPTRLNKQTYARIIVNPSIGKSWTGQQNIDCEILKL